MPADSVVARSPGHIFEKGWRAGYVWDSEGGEEYLEVLAQHRMTEDRHFRVFASGRVEELSALAPGYGSGSPNATDEEIARAKRASVERNRRIYEELRARGLLPAAGENLPAHEINEYLRSGGSVEPPE